MPAPESFDLERGDIIDLTNPLTGDVLKGRIIGIARSDVDETATVQLVEVN